MTIIIKKNDGSVLKFDYVNQVYIPPEYAPGLLTVLHHNRYIEYFRVRQLKSWSVDMEEDGKLSSEDVFRIVSNPQWIE